MAKLRHIALHTHDPEAGAEYRQSRPEAATTSFFEEKYKGPDGVMIDISAEGWVGAKPPAKDSKY